MEFLNYLLIGSVVSISLLIYYRAMAKIKLSVVQSILFCSIISLSVALFKKNYFWVITFNFVLILYFYYNDKKSIKNSFIYTFIISFVFITNENIIKTIIIIMFGKSIIHSWKLALYAIIWFSSAIIFSILLKRFIKYFLYLKSNSEIHYFSIIVIFISFSFVTICGISSNYYIDNIAGNTKFYILNFIIFITIISIAISFSLVHIKYNINKKILEEKNNSLLNIEEYAKTIENFYTKIKVFKEDYNNILNSTNYLLQKNKLNELKNYFNTILNSNLIFEEYNFLISLKSISLTSLKGLFSSKLIKASNLGIKIDVSINEIIDESIIDEFDKIRLFGNLLDNAIDAANNAYTKEISIIIYKKNNTFVYIIKNSYSNQIPPLYKIFKKGFSTKEDHSGIGLSSVKEILDKYKCCYMNIFIESSIFNVEIIIQ
jgi:two-component system sensor histidine kinase AgrC